MAAPVEDQIHRALIVREQERFRKAKEDNAKDPKKKGKKATLREITRPWSRRGPALCQEFDLLTLVDELDYDLADAGFQQSLVSRGLSHIPGEPRSQLWFFFEDHSKTKEQYLKAPYFKSAEKRDAKALDYTADEMDAHWRAFVLGRQQLQDAWEVYQGGACQVIYGDAPATVEHLYSAATPVLRLTGLRTPEVMWKRQVKRPTDKRRGPWRAGLHEILDAEAWNAASPCIYIVRASDGGFRYVGMSTNRLTDRWRPRPADYVHPEPGLPPKLIFHSTCWPKAEAEFLKTPGLTFEVRTLWPDTLRPLLKDAPAADLPDKAMVQAVEAGLRAARGATLFPWNAQ